MNILKNCEQKAIHPALQKSKEKAIESLSKIGSPTTKLEEFKKTNISQFFEKTYSNTNKPTLNGLNSIYSQTKNEFDQTVIINGQQEKSVSHDQVLKTKMVVTSLQEAIKEYESDVLLMLNAPKKESYLNLFSEAVLDKGIFIKVPKKTKIDFYSLFNFASSEDEYAFNNTALFIYLDDFSELNLEEHYKTFFNHKYFNFNQTYIYLKKGSKLTHARIVLENEETFHLGNINVFVEKDASYNTAGLNLSSKLTRIDLNVYLREENAHASVNGLLALKNSEHSDVHSYICHEKPNTQSEQLYKSILDGNSHGVFVGTIFVAPQAQKVQSSQLNKTLLLSKSAHIDTEPQLFIHADDVKAGHGAAIGNLSDDQVFYFQSRGINEDKVKSMLSHAFANEVFMKLNHAMIENRLSKLFFNQYEKDIL